MKLENLINIELKNGMRFLCMPNNTNPTISMTMKTTSGSWNEPLEKSGLSGMAASLITKGSVDKSATEIAEAIDSLGMDVGFSVSKHSSTLSGRMLSSVMLKALKLITEILSTPNPPQDELDRIRQRIMTGLMMKKEDPGAMANDRLHAMIYGKNHPYGRGVDAALASVPKITLADINGFYAQLQPAGFIGIIVGDFEPVALEKDLNKTLGSWQGGGEFKFASPEPVALPKKPQDDRIIIPGKPQSDVALGFQGIKRSDADFYALSAGNTAMGRLSLGGRIGQRVRDEEGMAYYAFSAFDAGIGAGPYTFRAGVNPVNEDRAVELALEEMNKVKSDGITAEELDASVSYMAGSMARQLETNAGMASMLMNQIVFDLGNDYFLRYPDIMRALTLEEVNTAMSHHLHTDHYSLVIAGPEKE